MLQSIGTYIFFILNQIIAYLAVHMESTDIIINLLFFPLIHHNVQILYSTIFLSK